MVYFGGIEFVEFWKVVCFGDIMRLEVYLEKVCGYIGLGKGVVIVDGK